MGNLLATTPAEQLRSTIGAMIAAMNDGSVLIKSAPGEEINFQGPVVGLLPDVVSYGLSPSNTAAKNDAAVATLLAAVNAGTVGKIEFQEGTYQLNTKITWPTLTRNLIVEGKGDATVLQFNQTDGTDAMLFSDEVPSNSNLVLRDFQVKGSGASSGNGIVLQQRGNIAVYSVWASDFGGGSGFLLDGAEQVAMFQPVARRNKYGYKLQTGSVGTHLGPNANWFHGLSAQSNTDTGLWIAGAGVVAVFGGAIQSNTKNGVLLTGSNSDIGLYNIYFEGHNAALVAGQGSIVVQGTCNDLLVVGVHSGSAGDTVDLLTANPTMKAPHFIGGDYNDFLIGANVTNARLDDLSIGGTYTDNSLSTSRYRPTINRYSASWTPGSIAAGSFAVIDVPTTTNGMGGSYGVTAQYGTGLVNGLFCVANIASASSVRVTMFNLTAGAVTPTPNTVYVTVFGVMNS